jgi:hypothetical protein
MNTKNLVAAAFSGEFPGDLKPVLLIGSCYAARLAQLTVRELYGDPMTLAQALEEAQELFDQQAVCVGLDITLLAEACGRRVNWTGKFEVPSLDEGPLENPDTPQPQDIRSKGRFGQVLEATERIVTVLAKRAALLGALTGPATLARQLAYEKGAIESPIRNVAERACQVLSRAYLESKVDHLLLMEGSEARTEDIRAVIPAYRSLCNLAHFFNTRLVLLTASNVVSEMLVDIPVDVIISEDVVEMVDTPGVVLGSGLDVGLLEKGQLPEEACRRFLEGGRRRFLATTWEVRPFTPPEILHKAHNIC